MWNEIYLINSDSVISDDLYRRQLENCKEYYEEIEEEDFHSIDACVDFAIREGNHAAFAKFFLNTAKSSKEIFQKKLEDYIKEYKEKSGQTELILKILKPEFWENPEYEYNDEDKDAFYSESSLYNWQHGYGVPIRDAVIQIGFFLRLNTEQTDELLRTAGYEKLYILNLMDVIALYYLDYFSEGAESYLSGSDKIKRVKKEINQYLGMEEVKKDIARIPVYKTQKRKYKEEEYEDAPEFIKEIYNGEFKDDLSLDDIPDDIKKKYKLRPQGNVSARGKRTITTKLLIEIPQPDKAFDDSNEYYVWNIKNRTLYYYKAKKGAARIGSTVPLDENIYGVIEKHRNYLENYWDVSEFKDSTNTDFLTEVFRKETKAHIETGDSKGDSFEDFLKGYMQNEDVRSVYSFRYYGYLKKTVDFLREPKKYLKNLSFSSSDLTVKDVPKESMEKTYLNTDCENFAKRVVKNLDSKGEQTYIQIANYLWEIENVLEKDIYEQGLDIRYGGKRYKVRQLKEGRNIAEDVPVSERNESKQNAYVLNFSKKDLMKFAIGMGREEEIGQYLKLAGFWDCDLCSKSGSELSLEEYDRIDLLIVYAHKYEERLLKEWAGNESKGEEYISEMAEKFPFLKLVQIINRDIQFVAEKIEMKPVYVQQEINGELVYPLLSTTGRWADPGTIQGLWVSDKQGVWLWKKKS